MDSEQESPHAPQRTTAFLMANLGSEVARMYAARETNDPKRLEESCARALHIIDSLFAHPQLAGRTGEIEILRNVVQDEALPHPTYTLRKSDLEAYFMPFALRALKS